MDGIYDLHNNMHVVNTTELYNYFQCGGYKFAVQETPELTSHGYTKSTPIFRAVFPKEKLRADCTAPSQQGIKESHREWPESWSNHNDGNPNFDVENCTSRGNTEKKSMNSLVLRHKKA